MAEREGPSLYEQFGTVSTHVPVQTYPISLPGGGGSFDGQGKDRANDPWYAVVESLRQLRLFLANDESRTVFAQRGSIVGLPADIPVTSLVLAPIDYYSSRGKKQNAVKPSSELLIRFAARFGVDLRLAVWDVTKCEIRNVPGSRLTSI